MFGGMSDVVHGTIKRFFVRLRRLGKAAELADELKRRCANLVVRRWRKEVVKGLDVSAHSDLLCLRDNKDAAGARFKYGPRLIRRPDILLLLRRPFGEVSCLALCHCFAVTFCAFGYATLINLATGVKDGGKFRDNSEGFYRGFIE